MIGAIFVSLAGVAQAWSFSPIPICTVNHTDAGVELTMTYDPRDREYAIKITLSDRPWQPSDLFAMQFDGARPIFITTDRHQLSDGDRSLSVTDRGFGNVLNGLEFNVTATADLGGQSVDFSLLGAAEPVRQFRDCVAAPSV